MLHVFKLLSHNSWHFEFEINISIRVENEAKATGKRHNLRSVASESYSSRPKVVRAVPTKAATAVDKDAVVEDAISEQPVIHLNDFAGTKGATIYDFVRSGKVCHLANSSIFVDAVGRGKLPACPYTDIR
jgi:hypothetical protein